MSKNNISRTRRILDVLDQIAGGLTSSTEANTSSIDMSTTQKWLHDISVGKSPGPPRTSIRTPSRLYSIASNVRDKPYWKRPAEAKPKQCSIEADTEPTDTEVTSSKVNHADLPKVHQPVLKSVTGKNIAFKSNTFNANLVDLEDDVATAQTEKTLENIKLPSSLGKNIESGFLTKNKTFIFSKPVIRGPQTVLEKSFEKEESSSDDSSEDEVDKEVVIAPKPLHSETSSSDNSPDSSKRQQTPQSTVNIDGAPPTSTTNLEAWECPTCMVSNDASAENCVCCATPSPKSGVVATNDKSAATAFKPTVFSKPANSGFTFGLTTKPSEPVNSTTNTVTNGLSFGNTTATNSCQPAAPFPSVFGASKPGEPVSNQLSQSAAPPTSNNMFGQTNGAPFSLFGQSKPLESVSNPLSQPTAPAPTNNMFGQTNGAPFSQFGQSKPVEPVSNQLSQPTAPAPTNNMFGQINGAPFSLFGQSKPVEPVSNQLSQPTAPTTTNNMFGQNSAAATPFSFNTTATSNGFNFGNTPAAPNFQFGANDTPSTLFNAPGPPPSFGNYAAPSNTFMPVTGGNSSSSTSRKLLLAKRKKRG